MIKELLYTIFIAVTAICVNVYWDDIEKVVYKKGEPVQLNTVFGILQGQTGFTRLGRKIYKFTSIPYGVAKRFEPPLEFGKWQGVLDATKKSPVCLQVDLITQEMMGQENCLYLNIYTPHLNVEKNELLPVMVYIHGGLFMFGSQQMFGPEYLLDENVVLVTLNYRLNVLGFLNTGDKTVTGNQGLKDQTLALKWIKAAIRNFGGNENSVTLFGSSAGGASVGYHMLSKLSLNYFQKSISQSGTALCPWALIQNPKKQAERFGSLAGCPVENSIDLVKCLKRKPAEQLVAVHYDILNVFHDSDAQFGPTIEVTDETTDHSKIFLSESPTKLLKAGRFNRVPLILGVTNEEGCFRSPLIVNDESKLNQLNDNWTSILPQTLYLNTDDPTISDKIREEYFPRESKSKPTAAAVVVDMEGNKIRKEDLKNITNMYSDRYFLGCSRDAAIFHSQHAPVYMYHFIKKPNMGYGYVMEVTRWIIPGQFGIIMGYLKFLFYHHVLGWKIDSYETCHTDELQQLFRLIPELEISANSEDFPFSEAIVKLWVSFAKNGKPDNFQGVEWTKVDSTSPHLEYLQLGGEAKMIQEPFTSRLKFWETLRLVEN